jgi:NAD(P)-dependent dehydrogenase (short-subunit alcohol dehydrogenase family)
MNAKHVVITGGSKGIGLGLAQAFLDLGCRVTICSRSEKNLHQALAHLKKHHNADHVYGWVCDVRQSEQIEGLWDAAREKFQKIDIWINNAGLGQPYELIWDLDPDQSEAIISANITGTVYGSQVAYRGMNEQGFGKILNLEGFGSNGMKRPGLSVYGTTKSAITYFTRSMAKEIRSENQTGILVGTISPGMVITDLLMEAVDKNTRDYKTILKIFNLMANTVEDVAPGLAKKILKTERQGVRIRHQTPLQFGWHILKNQLTNRKVIPEDHSSEPG